MNPKNGKPGIDILLATYNGAAYLDEQLRSLAAQSVSDWRLIARDDGSSDDTPALLRAFRDRHPDRVAILEDDLGRLGACRNYGHLLARSDADYVAFCDQDDVWIPEKLERSLKTMQRLEAAEGSERPILVFTDLAVVDQELKPIGSSLWAYQRLDPNGCRDVSRLMLQNVATGCTMLLNRALIEKALPLPERAFMHDWWIALVASAFGVADFISEPTVRYRQHGNNVLGARGAALLTRPDRVIRTFASLGLLRERFAKVFAQGSAFCDRYCHQLSANDRERIATILDIPRANYLRRAYLGWKAGALANDVPRMALLLALSGES